ncbi:MAG: uroporphyrinogen-III synthase [Myxococcales bacterium]|nr:uroporphyrinogen-III synthase [Myxococcales bacterium]
MTVRLVGLVPGASDLATGRASRVLGAATSVFGPRAALDAARAHTSGSHLVESPPTLDVEIDALVSASSTQARVCRVVLGDPVSDAADLVRALEVRRVPIVVVPAVSLDAATRAEATSREALPLAGVRVLVTRAASQGDKLGDLLRDAGACPVSSPLIAIGPSDDPEGLREAARSLARGAYAAVLYSSQNAVHAFHEALAREKLDARAYGGARVIAIGPSTAKSLQTHGIVADCVAREHVGEGLAAEALAALGEASGARAVLFPRAKVAREVVPEALRAAGYEVHVVTAYVTERPHTDDVVGLVARLRQGDFYAVTFTSPSTVEALVALFGGAAPALPRRTAVVCIGDVTRAACETAGLRVDATARPSTAEGLVEALTQLFSARGAS